MPSPAIAKVEDAIAAQIDAYASLSDYTVVTGQSADEALAEGTDKAILISTAAYSFDVADENWMTIHTALIEVESVSQYQAAGTINRANQTVLAHVVAAIAADRSVGGRLQDIQEIDVAPSAAIGKDVGSASLQFRVQFFTPRGDHFTINGPGGTTF